MNFKKNNHQAPASRYRVMRGPWSPRPGLEMVPAGCWGVIVESVESRIRHLSDGVCVGLYSEESRAEQVARAMMQQEQDALAQAAGVFPLTLARNTA